MSHRTNYKLVKRGELVSLVSSIGVTVRTGRENEVRDYALRMALTIEE